MDADLKKEGIVKYISQEWKQLPSTVKHFAIRGILILTIWCGLYYPILKPDSRVDNWLTKVTTQAITNSLNRYYGEGFTMTPKVHESNPNSIAQTINYNNEYALGIWHPCNGLNLFVLYLGFLFCAPGSYIRKGIFSLIGIAFIFVINVARCYALVWLNLNKPEWTDFAHHYAFTTIVYVFIFLFWVIFLNEREKIQTK